MALKVREVLTRGVLLMHSLATSVDYLCVMQGLLDEYAMGLKVREVLTRGVLLVHSLATSVDYLCDMQGLLDESL
ncbi:Uncharacterized protein OBRU01_15529 [Operophtera brumata]|uniref:Uncharacterized protein n=1 Tax=Operophtera brumata TaxID=104452 RepID=A0A0L7L4U6_OPEBR|nr:Uncharacterized protein OBRU01_15529 [Operophtera brumata]